MTPIFAPTRTTLKLATEWAKKRGAHPRFLNVIPIYFELCPIYEIPVESALAQAAKETAYGHYTGVVIPEFHNWCGLKTKTASGDKLEDHMNFTNDRQGVEAHLQHLRRYGNRPLPAGRQLLDPRWHLVTKFTDTIEGLGGAWAPALNYGTQVVKIIASIPLASTGMPKLFGAYNHVPRIDRSLMLSWQQIAGLPNFPGNKLRQLRYVTKHETANPNRGANALMHRNFVANGGGQHRVSFQWTVDGVPPLGNIIQITPVDASCWQAGDGNGPGNRESTAIEGCINVDGDFNLMLYNSSYLIANLQIDHKVKHEDKFQHNHWSGKNCPATLRATGKWGWFLEGVQQWEDYLMSSSERTFDTVPYVLKGDFKRYWEMMESMRVPGTNHSLVWLVLGYPQENQTERDITYGDGVTRTRVTQVCEYGLIVSEPEMAPPYNIRHLMLRYFESIPGGGSGIPLIVKERAGVIGQHQREVIEKTKRIAGDVQRIAELGEVDRDLARKIETEEGQS